MARANRSLVASLLLVAAQSPVLGCSPGLATARLAPDIHGQPDSKNSPAPEKQAESTVAPAENPKQPDEPDKSQGPQPTTDSGPVEVREEKWPNGTPKSSSEGYLDEDGTFVRHGLTTTWYESGLLNSKTYWRDGLPHGERTTWYFHGQMWARGYYFDGLEDGTWTRWHQNGQKHSEWTLRQGVWDGVYREWHDNGKPRMEVEWVNGLRQGLQYTWDEQGVLVQTADYVDGVEQP